MNASAAEPWVRLGLVQGRSRIVWWDLKGSHGPAMIVVGASSSCNWVVDEAGVAPLHFSLYWDGRALRIARSPGAPGVSVDGETIWHDWRPLAATAHARIEFGGAAIVVETQDGVEQAQAGAAPRQPAASDTALPSPPVATASARPPSVRAPKPTLIGMAYTPPDPGPASAAPQASFVMPGPSAPVAPARGVGASLGAEDQRTVPGYVSRVAPVTVSVGGSSSSVPPARRDPSSDLPSRERPVVTQAPMHPISAPAPASTVLAVATPEGRSNDVLTRAEPSAYAMQSQAEATRRDSAPSQAVRMSNPPQGLQPAANVESNRAPRPFPWHYAFVAVLTVVAYFAWLYLLDHF